MSNASKKKTFDLNETVKVPKKIKNLRYFLKKKRNVMLKHSPSQMFARSALNTTTLDNTNKCIMWTVELIFLKTKNDNSDCNIIMRESEVKA